MAWLDLDQLARDANNGDPAAANRLRDAASSSSDVDALLDIAARYPTGEEAADILARRVLQLDPANERAWEALAAVYDLYDGQWLNERTRVAVERLLSINPNNLTALRICLLHAHNCRDLPRALETAEHMLSVDPLNFSAAVARAKLLAADGDVDRALALMDEYIHHIRESDHNDRDEIIRLSTLRRQQIEDGELEQGVWP